MKMVQINTQWWYPSVHTSCMEGPRDFKGTLHCVIKGVAQRCCCEGQADLAIRRWTSMRPGEAWCQSWRRRRMEEPCTLQCRPRCSRLVSLRSSWRALLSPSARDYPSACRYASSLGHTQTRGHPRMPCMSLMPVTPGQRQAPVSRLQRRLLCLVCAARRNLSW